MVQHLGRLGRFVCSDHAVSLQGSDHLFRCDRAELRNFPSCQRYWTLIPVFPDLVALEPVRRSIRDFIEKYLGILFTVFVVLLFGGFYLVKFVF